MEFIEYHIKQCQYDKDLEFAFNFDDQIDFLATNRERKAKSVMSMSRDDQSDKVAHSYGKLVQMNLKVPQNSLEPLIEDRESSDSGIISFLKKKFSFFDNK